MKIKRRTEEEIQKDLKKLDEYIRENGFPSFRDSPSNQNFYEKFEKKKKKKKKKTKNVS